MRAPFDGLGSTTHVSSSLEISSFSKEAAEPGTMSGLAVAGVDSCLTT